MRVGCPIRRSRDHRSLASPPGFSQRATSFIASQRQGIHQMPFCLRLITASPLPAMPHHRRAQGQAPCLPRYCGTGGLYEDTSLGHIRRRLCSRRPDRRSLASPKGRAKRCLPPACPPRSHHNSLFTLQLTPRRGRPRRCRSSFSETSRTSWLLVRLGAAGCTCRPATPGLAGGASRRRGAAPVARRTDGSPVVEVNGFEPMTSCLQSRRSPR